MIYKNQYTKDIIKKIDHTYKVANSARSKGYDPEDKVNIPLAKNLAERVEGLVSIAAPQIINKGIPKRIKELERELRRKDKALAETAALLVLQKKLQTLWEDEDE